MSFDICLKDKCTGCTACMNICPKKAITMQQNDEGFFYPFIDDSLCVKCGKCKLACPINKFDFLNDELPKCYAVMASDELRKDSSSGAFFPVLANFILEKNGLVVGAAFDENMVLKHTIISDSKYLYKLKGSKYLQSQLSETFSTIKNTLAQNKKVLFVGTPCQVAGLKKFLSKKYDNLISIDLICHGVPSQKVFDNYLQSEFPNQKVINTNFRDKKNGWGSNYYTTTTTKTTVRTLTDEDDSFLQAFFSNVSLRKCCYDCNYAKMPRVGDFTIGDFWGVPKEMNDNKGTSVVFLNNHKAKEVWKEIKSRFKKVKEYSANIPIKIQPQLNRSVSKHPAREDFFKNLSKKTLKETLNDTIFSPKNVGLLNFHWENCNFGAVLTSFALNYYLNEKGYFARNIDYIPSFPWIAGEQPNPYFDIFRKKYMPMTSRYYSGNSLKQLNDEFSTFIVGSDQVWRPEFIKNERDAYFLSFAQSDKRLISYAASFGVDKLNMSTYDIEDYKMRISLFDAVSVRESSGVQICNNMGIEATQVCDPVFLLEKNKWNSIAQQAKCQTSKIIYYTINAKIEADIENFIEANKAKLSCNKGTNITENMGVEEWLYKIKSCNLFITDSFHGSCFAIIFNKPFICVNYNKSVSTRMESLFSSLGITNRLYNSFEDINLDEILKDKIDYNKVNEKISQIRSFSEDFLVNSLNKKLSKSKEKEENIKIYRQYRQKNALKNKNKVLFKYIKYKILSKITFGKKRKKYKSKSKEFKIQYKSIKSILKEQKIED